MQNVHVVYYGKLKNSEVKCKENVIAVTAYLMLQITKLDVRTVEALPHKKLLSHIQTNGHGKKNLTKNGNSMTKSMIKII
jgi:hypothetical protein